MIFKITGAFFRSRCHAVSFCTLLVISKLQNAGLFELKTRQFCIFLLLFIGRGKTLCKSWYITFEVVRIKDVQRIGKVLMVFEMIEKNTEKNYFVVRTFRITQKKSLKLSLMYLVF